MPKRVPVEVVIPPGNNYLGTFLRYLRTQANKTHSYIAERTRLNRVRVTNIENGKCYLRDQATIAKWVEALDGSPDDVRKACKLSLITYPQMVISTFRLSIEDRIRLLALIQMFHTKGMPEEIRNYIDSHLTSDEGVVVRSKGQGNTNIPDLRHGHSSNQHAKTSYEDYKVTLEGKNTQVEHVATIETTEENLWAFLEEIDANAVKNK